MKLRRKLRTLFMIVFIGALAISGYIFIQNQKASQKPVIEDTMIETRIQNISELAGSELTYRGLITFSDGDIPLLTQKGFSMIYTADMKADIDVSKITFSHTDDTITFKCPASKLLTISVDPDSIAFYDRKNALFNRRDEDDMLSAMKEAKKNARKKALETDLLSSSDKNIRLLLKSLFSDLKTRDGKAFNIQIVQDKK